MENTPETNEKKYTLEEIIEIIKALRTLDTPNVIYVYPYTQPWNPVPLPYWKPYTYSTYEQPFTTIITSTSSVNTDFKS